MNLEASFINEEIKKMYYEAWRERNGRDTGLDLISVETVHLKRGELTLIDTGIILRPPEGYYLRLVPRSSTFKRYGIIQPNSPGTIDQDYCGEGDIIKFPAIALFSDQTINAGERFCQVILEKFNPIMRIYEFTPESKNRGGFGSTGV